MHQLRKVLLAFVSLSLVVIAVRCGRHESRISSQAEDVRADYERLVQKLGALSAIVNSDYASCPSSGDTADMLIRKICTVAQAATNEARLELKGQLAAYAQFLQTQLTAINTNILNHTVSLTQIQSDISTINGQIATLTTRMTSAEAAILALQTLTEPNIFPIEIGIENAGSGPIYETVYRQNDKKKFTGFVDNSGYSIGLPNNPLTSTNNSANLTVTHPSATCTISNASPTTITWAAFTFGPGAPVRFTTTNTLPAGITAGTIYYMLTRLTANTFRITADPTGTVAINTTSAGAGTHTCANTDIVVGDRVELYNVTAEPGGFTSGELKLRNLVTAVNAANFVLTMKRVATANSAGVGGNVIIAQKQNGSGMRTFWLAGQASDAVVRQTATGSDIYNYIIRRISTDVTNQTAELCYDRTNATATFATINAAAVGGSGNISCK